ncbi:hypothetical protein D0Z07_2018 [Hyphodiscus hymeniophilus]|uniref:Something about silencing protein 4 domain-containing protein n=1 Tax=Hyphodiscus hymeniophilus TaxID=353542 RepID=A0A9P6VPZ2_9HELO|nr:hypothetical protein D0Z07_2018 [Hyphodiscus hymeniophilus]
MASLTLRSSRKYDGLKTRTRSKALGTLHDRQQSNIGRKKRPRDSLDDEKHSINPKRVKIAIEIDPFPKDQPTAKSVVIQKVPTPLLKRSAPPEKAISTQTSSTESPPQKTTPHHEKVVNGIRHELNRLQDRLSQPLQPNLKDEKRKLRSQEGQRFKSELSLYFPDYDEVIGNDPKEDHILNFDTPIIIIDNAKPSAKQPSSARKTHEYPLKDFPSSLFDDLHDAERVDFSFLNTHYKDDDEDPLSDAYFESIHKRPERQEKSIRNNDKGRAQHEKDQVIRLLEGLQGPDWLKIMGVSGVTDSRKKEFEPARHHFIKGCHAIIEKFRIWREEEKRRKLEKDQAMAEAEAEEDDVEGDEDAVEEEEEEAKEVEEVEMDGYASDGDPPDYSDVDASAARQLHEEAIAQSAPLRPSKRPEKRARVVLAVPEEHELEKDFKSFFSKPHLREAALGRGRRSGRISAAWGQPVPEVPTSDFDLPEEYRDEETLRAHARKRRRDRRVSKS